MNTVFIAKFIVAIVAFLFSILSYVLLITMGALPSSTDAEPEQVDIAWSYIGKAMSGAVALMSIGLWYLVFAL